MDKQLTKEQAVVFANSGLWKAWTPEQIVKFQLFQNLLCMDFSDFHEAMETVLDRPVFTHEFAWKAELQKEYLGEKPAPTFDEIVALIPPDKLIAIGL